jgi:hypothetical protein
LEGKIKKLPEAPIKPAFLITWIMKTIISLIFKQQFPALRLMKAAKPDDALN